MNYLTQKHIKFLDAYFGEAARSPLRAAELAGYKNPKHAGLQLLSKLSKDIEEREMQLLAKQAMDSEEVIRQLSAVARDNTHKDQVKSLEILSRIHGLLNDKLAITVDRKQLIQDLQEQALKLKQAGAVTITSVAN